MHEPPRILVVDDNEANLDIARTRLESQGYEVVAAVDGEEALARVRDSAPDLVLLDIMMPKLDGIEVTRRLKNDASLPFIPIILVTAKADAKDVVAGLDAGGDDYLIKPFDHASLVARVRSMLRIKALHDTVEAQRAQLETLNTGLEARVEAQVAEIQRMSRLRRFLSPQLAEMIVTSGDNRILENHRREIVVLFCDMRGFTAFSETAEPEEVMTVLREYHNALGPLVHRHEGTLMHFIGDGLMVFFNDPIPCPDPAARAVRLAAEMRKAMESLAAEWRRRGHQLGFGVGVAQGYATLGQIGFEGHVDYTAIGTVTNLAARLCDAAHDGQILVSQRVAAAVEELAALEAIGELPLKGLSRPGIVHQVIGLRE
ncbi:Adenylate and Guanylate cyclase catalytic domain-containing protein [Rhizobiales bacterium GAS191]|nr:Adenylate and Guanylate cyclase catalytic domain-containing protein [Rhizobiales bacterium GAS113]SEC09064.1 Adenylate and Guanylate cyclase catalytic domain-containing protein [Rhizobiales bacterium GAS188]SED13331.1 Adenylate and Guanylate cyclase catalytic domain-containing protein [Rhizobiales bacterium GAS191]